MKSRDHVPKSFGNCGQIPTAFESRLQGVSTGSLTHSRITFAWIYSAADVWIKQSNMVRIHLFFGVTQLHKVPERDVFCKPSASWVLWQTCNSCFEILYQHSKSIRFSFVYRVACSSLLFQFTGMQRSLLLCMTTKGCTVSMSRALDFAFEGFLNTEQDLRSSLFRHPRALTLERSTAERLRDAKGSVNFIPS